MKLLTNKALRASRATFLTEETMALFETDDYRPAVSVDASHPLQATAAIPKLSLKEAWMPTTPHGREGFILAPCKA